MAQSKLTIVRSAALIGLTLTVGLTTTLALRAAAAEPAVGSDQVKVTRRSYDLKAIAASAVVPEQVRLGRSVWLQRCAYCHDGVGQPSYATMGGWIGAPTIAEITEEGFIAFVQGGTERMPGFSHALDDRQIAALIAFLKTVGPELKPTEAQLAGKSPTSLVNGD